MASITEIVTDPRWDELKQDPERFEFAKDKLFDDYVAGAPSRQEEFDKASRRQQRKLRRGFYGRIEKQFPGALDIAPPSAPEPDPGAVDGVTRATETAPPPAPEPTEPDVDYSEFVQGGRIRPAKPRRDYDKNVKLHGGGLLPVDAFANYTAAIEGFDEPRALDSGELKKHGDIPRPGRPFLRQMTMKEHLFGREIAVYDTLIDNWAENLPAYKRRFYLASQESFPGKIHKPIVEGIDKTMKALGLRDDSWYNVGHLAHLANERGGLSSETGAGRFLDSMAILGTDMPVFLLGIEAGIPLPVLLGGMEAAGQSMDKLVGDREEYDFQRFYEAVAMGLVLGYGHKIPLARKAPGMGPLRRSADNIHNLAWKGGAASLIGPTTDPDEQLLQTANTMAMFAMFHIIPGIDAVRMGRFERLGPGGKFTKPTPEVAGAMKGIDSVLRGVELEQNQRNYLVNRIYQEAALRSYAPHPAGRGPRGEKVPDPKGFDYQNLLDMLKYMMRGDVPGKAVKLPSMFDDNMFPSELGTRRFHQALNRPTAVPPAVAVAQNWILAIERDKAMHRQERAVNRPQSGTPEDPMGPEPPDGYYDIKTGRRVSGFVPQRRTGRWVKRPGDRWGWVDPLAVFPYKIRDYGVEDVPEVPIETIMADPVKRGYLDWLISDLEDISRMIGAGADYGATPKGGQGIHPGIHPGDPEQWENIKLYPPMKMGQHKSQRQPNWQAKDIERARKAFTRIDKGHKLGARQRWTLEAAWYEVDFLERPEGYDAYELIENLAGVTAFAENVRAQDQVPVEAARYIEDGDTFLSRNLWVRAKYNEDNTLDLVDETGQIVETYPDAAKAMVPMALGKDGIIPNDLSDIWTEESRAQPDLGGARTDPRKAQAAVPASQRIKAEPAPAVAGSGRVTSTAAAPSPPGGSPAPLTFEDQVRVYDAKVGKLQKQINNLETKITDLKQAAQTEANMRYQRSGGRSASKMTKADRANMKEIGESSLARRSSEIGRHQKKIDRIQGQIDKVPTPQQPEPPAPPAKAIGEVLESTRLAQPVKLKDAVTQPDNAKQSWYQWAGSVGIANSRPLRGEIELYEAGARSKHVGASEIQEWFRWAGENPDQATPLTDRVVAALTEEILFKSKTDALVDKAVYKAWVDSIQPNGRKSWGDWTKDNRKEIAAIRKPIVERRKKGTDRLTKKADKLIEEHNAGDKAKADATDAKLAATFAKMEAAAKAAAPPAEPPLLGQGWTKQQWAELDEGDIFSEVANRPWTITRKQAEWWDRNLQKSFHPQLKPDWANQAKAARLATIAEGAHAGTFGTSIMGKLDDQSAEDLELAFVAYLKRYLEYDKLSKLEKPGYVREDAGPLPTAGAVARRSQGYPNGPIDAGPVAVADRASVIRAAESKEGWSGLTPRGYEGRIIKEAGGYLATAPGVPNRAGKKTTIEDSMRWIEAYQRGRAATTLSRAELQPWYQGARQSGLRDEEIFTNDPSVQALLNESLLREDEGPAPEPADPPPAERLSKAKAVDKKGQEEFLSADEGGFKLVGEEGPDNIRIARENEAKRKAAQDHEDRQGKLFEPEGRASGFPRLPRAVTQHLDPDILDSMNAGVARGIVEVFRTLPDKRHIDALASAGEPARFWYWMFGRAWDKMVNPNSDDHWRFPGVLAATSSNKAVDANVDLALRVYAGWQKLPGNKQRDREAVERMLRGGVIGKYRFNKKNQKLYLDADVNNTIAVLTAGSFEDAYNGFSDESFKVQPFYLSIMGFTEWGAHDTRMGRAFGTRFRLDRVATVRAMDVAIRDSAMRFDWHPTEVQAAIWAVTRFFANKIRYELFAKKPENRRSLMEIMAEPFTASDLMPGDDIATLLLEDPRYEGRARQLGFDTGAGRRAFARSRREAGLGGPGSPGDYAGRFTLPRDVRKSVGRTIEKSFLGPGERPRLRLNPRPVTQVLREGGEPIDIGTRSGISRAIQHIVTDEGLGQLYLPLPGFVPEPVDARPPPQEPGAQEAVAGALRSPDVGSIRRGFQHSDSLSSVILEHLSGNIESWNPVGQYVRSHADWVALNLPLRSPLIETVSMAAIDADGQIIYAEISSVGKLGEARFHTSLVKDSIDRARAARGDKVVAIYNRHNHPSGHSPASADDIRIVSDVAGELKIDPRYKDIEYLGHDITNGDEYTILDDVIAYGIARATGGEIPPKLREAREEGYPEDLSILTETRPLPNPQKAPWEVLPRKQLAEIHGAPQFQRLSSDLRQGDPGIHHAVYLNTKFRITMMERLQDPAGALTAASQRAYRNYLDHIVQGARNSGSNGVLLQFSGEQPWSEPLVAYKLTRDLREKGITLLDASSPMTASFRDSGMLADIPRGGFGGSLFEPRAKYELTKSAATDKRLRDTKVVDEDGRPKMVYRGVWGDPEKLGAAGGTRHPAPSFSEAPLIASIYAHEAVSPGSAPRVTPTYLALKNPVRFPVNEPVVTAATLRELLKPAGEYEEGLFREILNEAGEWVDPGTGEPGNYDSERPGMYVHNFEVANAPAFVKLARRKGFDGAMYKGMFSPMFLSGGAAHAEAWYGFDVFKFMKDQGVTRRQLNDWEDNGAWEYRPFDPGTQAVSPYDLKAGGLDELVKDSARRRYLREPQRSYGSSKRPPSGRTTPPEADPTFSSLRMDLPEAVWLAQMMNEGKIPAVRKMIARRNALGIARLSSATGTDTPAIELRADTAKIMTPEEIRQLKFEAFSWAVVQWGTRKANAGKTAIEEYQTNPKARDQINSLKAKRFSETLEKEKERLKFARSPVQAVSVILHEIGHWGDFLPTHILTRGNIFGHIAKLGRHLKGSINALPPGDQDLLSKADRQQVRKVARQQIRAEMGSQPKDEPDKSTWGDAVSERYGELLKAEHHDRGLFRLADLKPEMEEIMKWWNGWDPNLPPPEYFLKPEETYAELFSIFMNNEAAFRARAPLTWQLWQNHMVSHPPVHKLYSQLLNRLRTGTGGWRDARIRLLDGMADSDSRWHKLRKLERTLSWGEHLDALSLRFDRAQGPIMRRLDNAHRDPDQYGQVWKSIEDYLYRATAAEKFLTRATAEVQSLLVAANLDWPNLGEFMFHRRVINERFELYNTQGFDPKSSQAVLDEIKADDPHNFDVLLDAAKKYRSIYEEEVIPLLHGIFDQQIMTFIEDNVYYAPFMHPKGPDPKNWSIEEALKARYGDAVVPHIYKQIGSLENVMNPATALAMKAISLINMAHREKMKWEVTRFLADETLPWHKEVEKVEFRWKSEQMPREPRMRNDTRIGTVLGLRDGQVYGYYLPRAVADFLNTQPAQQVLLPIRAMNWATRGVKTLLVNANPGYWGYQITKDLRAFSKNMPGAALFGAHSFWEFAGPAWRAARASMKHREDPTSYMMLDRKVPITVANYKGMDTEDQAFERLQLRFHITPGTWNAKAKHPGVVAYDAWNRWVDTGQTLERWVKYAGMMYVDKYFPQMPEWEKLLIVHSQSGSPNFLHKGLWNQYTMFAMLFYNPWKEGWRREWQAFDRSHIGYSYRLARQTIMPKVAMAVAAAGGLFFLGKKAREEIRLMYASVSEYDMTNYLVLPLAWADRRQRKLLYFRMPLDEQERFISGILWKLMHPHQERGEGLLSYAGGQAPGPNPIVSVGVAWSLTASGINPPDPFRGDKVVPEQVWKADDHRAREEMLGWSSNQLGGGIIYRFSRDSWYEANPGRLERFLEAPVIGNTLGRWLKVSNKGIYDRVRPHVEDVQKLAERGHLDAKERLNDMLNDPSRKTLDALIKHVDENPQFGDYIDRVSDPMAGSRLGPEFRLLLNARTDAERLAIINTLEKYGIDFSLSEGLPAELERLTELPGSGGKRSSFKPSGAPSTMRLVPVPLKEPD